MLLHEGGRACVVVKRQRLFLGSAKMNSKMLGIKKKTNNSSVIAERYCSRGTYN